MRAADVRAALAKKFAAPEYALFYEVGDATGGRSRRWADAVAMGLWPSRGLALQGFEIKVSRQDWLNELKQPAKAEAIAQYMRYWWIVTPPGIVRDGELPETWGLYEVHANGLRVVKQAPQNVSERTITLDFLAALLRRADEHAKSIVNDAIAKAMADERAAVPKRIADQVASETSHLRGRAERAEERLKEIYAACGVADHDGFRRYGDDFARACGVVHQLGIANTYGGLKSIAERLRPMADAVDQLISAIPKQEAA